MSIALERRLSKDKVLELYLNDVPLGQRGSFAIHGVPEAARLFFGKDVSNLSLVEAATIAGVIQAPSRLSPFTNPERAKERRNVVLQTMAETGVHQRRPTPIARRASRCVIVARALESEAPHFVDYLTQELQERTKASGAVDVYSTLDLHLQRIAQDAVRDGLTRVDAILAKRQAAVPAGGADRDRSAHRRDSRDGRRPVLQPVAVQPRRQRQASARVDHSSRSSTWPRSSAPRRTAAPTSPPRPSSSTSRRPSRSTISRGRRATTTTSTTARSRCAARSPTRATSPPSRSPSRPGSTTSRRSGGSSASARRRKGYPSIALGVFEATPFEIATAYTVFPNGGTIRPLRAISRIVGGGKELPIDVPAARERRAEGQDVTS